MLKAASGIAIGQSIGNPSVRLDSETADLLEIISYNLDHPENLRIKMRLLKLHIPSKILT